MAATELPKDRIHGSVFWKRELSAVWLSGDYGERPIVLSDEITPPLVLVRAGLEALGHYSRLRRACQPPLYRILHRP